MKVVAVVLVLVVAAALAAPAPSEGAAIAATQQHRQHRQHGQHGQHGVASSLDGEDPMKEMMELMDDMIDLITNTSTQFTGVSDYVLDSIANMSHRIVYTEKLIDDEGIQIGWMSDKILETEEIVGNLTATCFCRNNTPQSNAARSRDKRVPLLLVDPGRTPPSEGARARNSRAQQMLADIQRTKEAGASQPSTGDNPWDDMIQTMEHAIDMMHALATNITNLMVDEVAGISTMANRIVDTECLIMDMSKQIGVMADRIVDTEGMMANASRICCHEHPRPLPTPAPTTAPLPTSTALPPSTTLAPDCKPYPFPNTTFGSQNAAVRILRRQRALVLAHANLLTKLHAIAASRNLGNYGRTLHPSGVASFPNPFNMAAKVMEKLMNTMIDEMEQMAASMASFIVTTTADIGSLADDIVQTERLINDMGLVIGKMADCILTAEEIGFNLFTKTCAAFQPKPLPPSPAPQHACTAIKPIHPVKPNAAAIAHRQQVAPTSDATEMSHEQAKQVLLPADLERIVADAIASSGNDVDGFNPFGDFAAMVKLCEKMAKMMASMLKDMGNLSSHVTGVVKGLGEDIAKTVGLINGMAGQINTMAGRIVETEDIVSQLANKCSNAP